MTQPDKSIPEFAGKPFAEKPPLAYWLAATSMSLLGTKPAAARLPNLIYAALTVLAVAGLAKAMKNSLAAVVAGLAAGSFQLAYQVSIWLVTDAPLVAGGLRWPCSALPRLHGRSWAGQVRVVHPHARRDAWGVLVQRRDRLDRTGPRVAGVHRVGPTLARVQMLGAVRRVCDTGRRHRVLGLECRAAG